MMRHRIYKYIQTHFSQQPKDVDRLIISAYIKKNQVQVTKNTFLKSYLIPESNIEATKKLDHFISLIESHFTVIDLETVIELFEFVLSPADRVITGAVYTPKIIRENIVKNILHSQEPVLTKWKAADIACGCGGFLLTVAQHIKQNTNFTYKEIFKNNIFGLDIKKYSTVRTKLLLCILAISEGEDEAEFQFNLFTGDALNFNWARYVSNFNGFNCIVGNPPYVCSRKIDPSTKKFLSKFEVCSTGHPDLYIPFFEISLTLLKKNGFLGFITMNSFFKSLNGRALRAFFQKRKYSFKIYDFGTLQVFKKRSTYTCICLIQNSISETLDYTRMMSIKSLESNDHVFLKIPYINLKSRSGWNLLHSDVIHKIEAVGIPFSKKFKTRTGIATLKNEIFIFDPVSEDDEYYYLLNGSLFPIERSICKEIINSNKLTNEVELSSLTEKVIFPYEFINGKATILSERRLQSEYPCAHYYLKTKKKVLETRDKGEGEYAKWFAFGRTQSLEQMRYKLFFPHITPHTPHFIINTDENLFFYNGLAVIGKNEEELRFLEKLMSSKLFWFYLLNTSKPYTSGYISMSKNYIKDFGIFDFSDQDVAYVINENNPDELNTFFEKKYDVTLEDFKL